METWRRKATGPRNLCVVASCLEFRTLDSVGNWVDESEYPEPSARALERKVILMVGESLVPAAQERSSAVFLSSSSEKQSLKQNLWFHPRGSRGKRLSKEVMVWSR